MTNLVRLKHYHKKVHGLDHELLDGAKTYTEDELQGMMGDKDQLLMALRFALRMLVGRYLGNWPETRRFEDEMVSEGFLALSQLMSEISFDFLAGRDILKVAGQHMTDAIEVYLNANQSLSAPSMSTQRRALDAGEDVLYRHAEADIYCLPDSHPETPSGEALRDVLDAFCKLEPVDRLDVALMDQKNWGRANVDLAAELGTIPEMIRRRKSILYRKYLELTE